MDPKILCPNCQNLSIKHSKFEVKASGATTQRYRCKPCGITFSLSTLPTFFKKMHTSPEKFNQAMKLFANIRNFSFRSIARQVGAKPDTIIKWVKKVENNQLTYRDYLKANLGYNEKTIDEFIEAFFDHINLETP